MTKPKKHPGGRPSRTGEPTTTRQFRATDSEIKDCRDVFLPGETLSEFVRAAIFRERDRRRGLAAVRRGART